MQERKWPPFALLSLLAYVPMGIAIHNQNVPQTLFTTIPPLIGAVAGAYLGLNEKRRQILSSPAAYAALVQRSFNNPHKVPGYI
jgi:integral membrane sensor domain MASE1